MTSAGGGDDQYVGDYLKGVSMLQLVITELFTEVIGELLQYHAR